MAASTTDTESAQALFCALADYVGTPEINKVFDLEKYPTYYDLTGYTGMDYNGKGYTKTLNIMLKNAKKAHEASMKELGRKDKFDEDTFENDFKKSVEAEKKTNQFWIDNNKNIKEAFKRTYAYGKGRVELDKLQKTLDDEVGWYKSSCLIAKKLVNDIGTIKGNAKGGGGLFKIGDADWNNIFYYRGDDEVMGVIADLYKIANNNTKDAKSVNPKLSAAFGDINKWSPADMYFATEIGKGALQKLLANSTKGKNPPKLYFDGSDEAPGLNDTINDQIDAGHLLPLSLKKVKDEVHLVKVNFDKTIKKNILTSVKFDGEEEVKFGQMGRADASQASLYTTSGNTFKFKMPTTGKGPIYTLGAKDKSFRDIRLNFKVKEGNENKEISMQFRHTPTSEGKPQRGIKIILGYKGASALAGQVVGIDWLCKLIAIEDSGFAKKLKTTFDLSMDWFIKDSKKYIEYGGGRALYQGKNATFMNDYLQEHKVKSHNAKRVEWGPYNSDDNTDLTNSGKAPSNQQKHIYESDMGAISGVTVMNPFRVVLAEYFNDKNNEAKHSNIIKQIFQYASSRSEKSGRFVIAK